MSLNEEAFLKRYNNLNPQQKEAVDTIYGPVMVIAGPGTGKTEVLSMRIANLLRSDAQVKPHEILCLTFTDEATIAMRRRLLQIIGDDAHRVNIYTFHAFCNRIIQQNPDYFGMRELMPISDLERMDLLYSMIEELPEGHALRRLKGDIFYDAKNLRSLFDLMKSEDWTAEKLNEAIDYYISDLPHRDVYKYKRANSKKNISVGDPKTEDIRKETERMERTRAAALLFPEYQQRMAKMGRYDFNDMILWVIKAFREHPDFLLINQERFQYLLADEFQDTSGAQSELLTMLSDYWADPNIFIVGDDDQSIFEFQGARLQNIVDFYEKYQRSIKVIILTENYRSSQLILDISAATIVNNKQRLIYQLNALNLDKNIRSAHARFREERDIPAPEIVKYYNVMHEEADIVARIEMLQQSGVPLQNVAVLYAQHKQAAGIIALLEKKGIPYWVKKPVNVLELPLVQQLLNILRYLHLETRQSFSGEDALFQLMHTPFFGIHTLDIATLSIYLQQKDRKHRYWRYLLQDSLLLETMPELKDPKPLYRLGMCLEKWIGQKMTLTLPMLFENILYDSGIVAKLLQGENQVWDMQVLHTFFDFIKEEADKKPRLSIEELLLMIEKMGKEGIAISIQKVVKQENGVRFYTAFSAKGHEFEHVFVIGVTKNFWEEKSGGMRGFSLPDTLTLEQQDEDNNNTEEVARRLFYVAVTRAKKHLQISYAINDNKKKDLEASRFVDEVSKEDERRSVMLENTAVIGHLAGSMMPDPPVQVELVKKELLDRRLENFSLSVSAMNKYLDCPLAFYYEYILQVPVAKSDSLAFGTSVHYALEQLFKKMIADSNKVFPSKEETIRSFQYAMRRNESAFTQLQFSRRMELGAQVLGEYYDRYIDEFSKVAVAEYNVANVAVSGVPIKGKIDKIEFDSMDCVVVDYKTGSPEYSSRTQLMGPTDSNPHGGDYWRQMVFYKILLDNYPPARGWKMTAGMFDFIEKNKKGDFVRYFVPIDNASVQTVKEQIKTVYGRIMNKEFDTGCGKEDCNWCNFVRTYELAKPNADVEVL